MNRRQLEKSRRKYFGWNIALASTINAILFFAWGYYYAGLTCVQ